MDAHRFDSVTKLIAQGKSRRGLLRIAGGALAGAIVLSRASEALAGGCSEADGSCNDADCCDGLFCINDVCAICIPDDADCVVSDDCCSGHCLDDVCVACVPDDGACLSGEDCCSGLCNDSTCVSCIPDGNFCTSDEDCCDSKPCLVNSCRTCVAGMECFGKGSCCNGFSCDFETYTCQPICQAPGEACDTSLDCCSGICCDGVCADIECCISDADPNEWCPSGQVCFEGVCDDPTPEPTEEPEDPEPTPTEQPPVKLPNTGSGSDGSNTGKIVLGLGAAGAALIAAKKASDAKRAQGNSR